jgi:hypothetical protein
MSEITDGDMAINDLKTREKSIQEASLSLVEHNAGLVIPTSQHWSFLTQVHGSENIEVKENGSVLGLEGDALFTTQERKVLTIQTADCVPVALISNSVAIAVIHAGWKGLLNGVIENASEALQKEFPGDLAAVIGPHIGPCCYEYGRKDLDSFIEMFGASVAGVTNSSTDSLDLMAIVRVILEKRGIELVYKDGSCTSCDSKFWSYRSSGTQKRQSLFAWIEKN